MSSCAKSKEMWKRMVRAEEIEVLVRSIVGAEANDSPEFHTLSLPSTRYHSTAQLFRFCGSASLSKPKPNNDTYKRAELHGLEHAGRAQHYNLGLDTELSRRRTAADQNDQPGVFFALRESLTRAP
ncbi:hypothetical protein CBL_02029 [Carabus blaptoides fortunei]